ncbi:MAG: shikimate dehydrogenase family protein, partial [Candidatus Adiutrix sp.]
IMPLIDEIDPEALGAGAVNTVLRQGTQLRGYNTDMEGFALALGDKGRFFSGQRILFLGAGGAASALAFKAAKSNAAQVSILARKKENAQKITQQLSPFKTVKTVVGEMNLEEISQFAKSCDILINCTPLGMEGIGDDFTSFNFIDNLPPHALVADLIYKPPQTRLLQVAKKRGLAILNGLSMLIYQAILADELFLNQKLDKQKLYDFVAKNINLK